MDVAEVTLYASQVCRRLTALPEPVMRRVALVTVLSGLSDDDAVALIGTLCRKGRSSPGSELALLALCAILDGEDLGYDRHADLYNAAKRAGDEVVARVLLSSGRQPGSMRAQFGDPVSEPTMPLGCRKSQARGHRRDSLDRLLLDPDPQVLSILLQNPRMVERDAVRVAARRPTSAGAQRAVFASRWGNRVEVRRALVYNPYTPVELSARILPGLGVPDIMDVAASLDLAPCLREAAKALLKR